MALRARIHIGTSGWSYEHWRGPFYARRGKSSEYLAWYAKQFETAEVNNSFYRLPEKKTIKEWRESVSKDFVFSVKASRFMTHMKKLKDPEEPVARLMVRVEVFEDQLGPILVQCPPNWRRNPERLSFFLKSLPSGQKFAFEFRDTSWFDRKIYDLLQEHQAALCIYNQDGETSPDQLTTDWTYVRFHSSRSKQSWDYSESELAEWADRCVSWIGEGITVYCYFNNDQDAAAPRNAARLIELVEERRQ
jgi:uncharacterized protein YecE (DUF72 family)